MESNALTTTKQTGGDMSVSRGGGQMIAPRLHGVQNHIVKVYLESESLMSIRAQHGNEKTRKSIQVKVATAVQASERLTGYRKAADMSENERQLLINDLTGVFNRCNWLHTGDIELILREGMLGNLGDFTGLNARVLNGWIKVYEEKFRKPTMIEQLRYSRELEEQQLSEISKEKAQEIMKRADVEFVSRLESLREAENVEDIPADLDPGNIWFERFQASGLLDRLVPWDPKKKREIFELQKKRIHRHLSLAAVGTSIVAEEKIKIRTKIECQKLQLRTAVFHIVKNFEDISGYLEANEVKGGTE